MKCTIPAVAKSSFSIISEPDALARLPEVIAGISGVDHVFLLYDKTVEGIARRIGGLCAGSQAIAVPSGEDTKSLAQVERIIEDLLLKGATKQSLLLNIGGGMVMDLGGFVASVFQRGIQSIQIPTNLIAMVDACLGGHTNINIGRLKNVMGTTSYPSAVIIDMTVLGSLQDEYMRDGVVEVVKLAAMWDGEFFGWLEENLDAVLDRSPAATETFITQAVRLKTEIVEGGDEADSRLFPAFGHTVGHAVEALTNFSMSHGEAVSIGMLCEMAAASTHEAQRVRTLLERLSMPVTIPLNLTNVAMWDIMKSDRKVKDGLVRIAVPGEIGKGQLRPLTFEEFAAARQ